jgi:hypothetical protein
MVKSTAILTTPFRSDREMKSIMGTRITTAGCTIVAQSAIVLSDAGKFVAAFVKGCLPLALQQAARPGLFRARGDFGNRGTFAGRGFMMPRVKANGTLSERKAVPKAILPLLGKTGQLGYFDYTDRQTGEITCRQTEWTLRDFAAYEEALPLVGRVSEVFRQVCPERYDWQKAEVEKIHFDYRIGEAVWTTLTVNINARGAVHIDIGDLAHGVAGLTADGEFEGAELVLPRYLLAFDVKPGDLLLFDPHEPHANAPLKGNRISVVFYVRGKLHRCKPASD